MATASGRKRSYANSVPTAWPDFNEMNPSPPKWPRYTRVRALMAKKNQVNRLLPQESTPVPTRTAQEIFNYVSNWNRKAAAALPKQVINESMSSASAPSSPQPLSQKKPSKALVRKLQLKVETKDEMVVHWKRDRRETYGDIKLLAPW